MLDTLDAVKLPDPQDALAPYQSRIAGRPIVLYDGLCVFCNRTIQFLLRRDTHGLLRFVPLETSLGIQLQAGFNRLQADSTGAAAAAASAVPSDPDGVILITAALTPAARLSRRSDAVSEVLSLLPAPWPFAGRVLRLIPRPLREFGYALFARLRYRFFGRHTVCPVPTPAQRSRILGIAP